ncbi:hypothetical protein CP960_00635 [Malaciobacter halophilus]|uniref:DUF502 domain-containing protein n=1 Tax=Malaciobacter halophilus TaxID=197482 RepID=A0A2N1J6L9_9BACT|nr:DUF502 domain-containing protein [Malaciobacter halophilus]AXH10700.1 DUF502 domain-containing membrane protein [Malaciobacter halophilus]PKI82174.1 hypothetical protein CP960_00635 [Malaciobacter halophilus]
MLDRVKKYLGHGKDHIFTVIIKGLFWLAPIVAITLLVIWIYENINALTGSMFKLFGLNPEHHPFIWTIIGVVLLGFVAYLIGTFVETRLGDFIQRVYSKIPGYKTIKELINIFNTSKSGEKKVLVVLIKGFTTQGYNIGLMYSTKESIIKNHYTVTLSMTPIPNGGYMFEVPKDKIYVIEEASFDTNLQYLLSMGVKSLAEIINVEPKNIEQFPSLEEYLTK